jgi:hypothetical protein
VAASEEAERGVDARFRQHGEAAWRDAIGGLHGRVEGDAGIILGEEAEEGRGVATVVVAAEAAGEGGVGDETTPALAGGGGAREGGRLRGQAEEDFGE